MKGILLDTFGYDRSEMTFYVDDGDEDSDGEPNNENLLWGINWLMEGADDGSHLFFMYAGHGSQTEDENGDEADGKDDCLCPCEGPKISDDDLFQMLVVPLPAGAKLHCVFDSCFSGTGLDLPFNFIEQDGSWSSVANEGASDASESGTVILFSSCREDQTAADLAIQGESCGAHTRSCSTNLSSGMTYAQLIEATRQTIIEMGLPQVAQMSSND
jgi:hypothetical protein